MLPKLNKCIRKLEDSAVFPVNLGSHDKVFLIGDSKVRWVKKQLQDSVSDPDRISFCSEKGSGSPSDFFKNLFKKLPKYRAPIVLIWFGTCEFTVKVKKYIYVKDVDLNAQLNTLQDKYASLKARILRHNRHAKVVFLDIPYCSLLRFNADRGHPNLSKFKGKDKIVNDKIDELNYFLKEFNRPYHSPRLSQDTIQYSKRRGRRTKQSRNFSAYKDGIHPDVTLARLWMLRIVRLIYKMKSDS